jgi:hypothetical protein
MAPFPYIYLTANPENGSLHSSLIITPPSWLYQALEFTSGRGWMELQHRGLMIADQCL